MPAFVHANSLQYVLFALLPEPRQIFQFMPFNSSFQISKIFYFQPLVKEKRLLWANALNLHQLPKPFWNLAHNRLKRPYFSSSQKLINMPCNPFPNPRNFLQLPFLPELFNVPLERFQRLRSAPVCLRLPLHTLHFKNVSNFVKERSKFKVPHGNN